MKAVKTYVCRYCRKESVIKLTIENHELECIYNPKVKSCPTCSNSLKLKGTTQRQCAITGNVIPLAGMVLYHGCKFWRYTPLKLN